MDWIDEKLKRWIYHADLKKALIFYICIAVASAALATVLTAQQKQLDRSFADALFGNRTDSGNRSGRTPGFFPSQEDIPGIAPICYSGSNVFGGVGNFFYGIGDDFPAAYMVPMLYYVANYGSGKKYLGKFFLFSMTAENSMDEKIWLFVGGSCLLILGIWWRTSGRRMITSGKVRIGERNQ